MPTSVGMAPRALEKAREGGFLSLPATEWLIDLQWHGRGPCEIPYYDPLFLAACRKTALAAARRTVFDWSCSS